MFSHPPWFLRTEGFDPELARHFEGLFTQGSGYLHLRGSLEEPIADAPQANDPLRQPGNVTAEEFPELPARWGCYVPGIFAEHPLLGEEMVNLPCFLLLTLEVDGEVFDVSRSNAERHRRTFDLRDGLLRRQVIWKTRGGARITVEFDRLVSAARPHGCCQRMKLSADRPVEVLVTSWIDGDVRTNGFDHFTRRESEIVSSGDVGYRVWTNGGDEVEIRSRLLGEASDLSPIEADRRIGLSTRLALDGEPSTIEKRTVLATSRDLERRPVETLLGELAALSWREILEENHSVWEERWRRSSVEIVGDPASRRALHTSIHHLLRSQVTGDDRVAIDAKGYAGEAYYGRFFWDTEMFLLPFFLYTDPKRARDLVSFRLRTLEGARANARREGFRGARYPWESSSSGLEQCPTWPYAEQEIHITADVVYGWVHYARAAEGAFLDEAAVAIVECARYWRDRIEVLPGGDLRLSGVLGPDEYTPSSTNNAYTNRLVRFNLVLAAELAERGGAGGSERAAFLDYADRLPIPRAEEGALVLQCDGFEKLEDPDFEFLWPDRSRPLAAQVPEERIYPLKALKQADVLALMSLFPLEFTDEEVRRAWEYYLPFTTHDSSLSAAVHGLVACRLNLREEAWSFWLASRDIDVDPPRGGAAEGVHAANAAGMWMAVVFGFAGLESAMWTERLTLTPRLPAAWGAVGFPLLWRGVPVRVEIERAATTVHNEGSENVELEVAGERRRLAPGASEVFRSGEGKPRPLAAVLFDLDGVLISTDHLHFEAWSHLAQREGLPFDWEVNHRLRGVSRRRSLEIILEEVSASYSDLEIEEMLEFKNQLYRASLRSLNEEDLLPGALPLLRDLRAAGVSIAVVSASRNAADILERTGLVGEIDLLVDGNATSRTKPDPEGFLLAAERLLVEPEACLVIEDAPTGVEAARRAGMSVVAIGDRSLHPDLSHCIDGLEELTIDDLRAIAASG